MSYRLPTAAALLCVLLTGCLTPHARPAPSRAVLDARAAHEAKPSVCPAGDLASVSPSELSFGFDEATISEVGQRRLAAAARWLGCNPGVEVVIKPDADQHGDAAKMNGLAQQRAQAAADQLRALGAKAVVVHMLARGAADPVTAPHLVINATGRGW